MEEVWASASDLPVLLKQQKEALVKLCKGRIDCFHLGGVKINLLQTWTSAPGRDSSLEYRLSIYHARVNDTGSYTCSTPFEQEHSIKILVKEVSLSETSSFLCFSSSLFAF